MIVTPTKTHVFEEGEDLFNFICSYYRKIPERSVVAITSKIVALSEGRTRIVENVETKAKLIVEESELAIPTKYAWLTVKDGVVMASAGIDESNADGKLILLPKDSFKTASLLHRRLREKYGVKQLGVLITDSRTMPLRAGVTGVAVGYAGFRGIKNYEGKPDIFGRHMKYARVDVADSLAASAVLVMGECAEQRPLALIEEVDIIFSEKTSRTELHISIQDDMYRPLFENLS